MRLANEIAAAAMEHCKLVIEPGMSEAQIAAEWEGVVHGEGTGWEGKVDLALGFTLVWSGPGIKTFTATTATSGRRGRADALRDLGVRRRLLGRPYEEPRRRRADARVPGARGRAHGRLPRRGRLRSAGGEPRRARPPCARGDREHRLPGAAVASDLSRDRRPRPRAAVRASGRRRGDPRGHGACNRARLLYERAAAASASRTTSSSRATRPRSCRRFPTASSRPERQASLCARALARAPCRVAPTRTRPRRTSCRSPCTDRRCRPSRGSPRHRRHRGRRRARAPFEERGADAGAPLRAMDVEAGDRPGPLVARVLVRPQRRHVLEPHERRCAARRRPSRPGDRRGTRGAPAPCPPRRASASPSCSALRSCSPATADGMRARTSRAGAARTCSSTRSSSATRREGPAARRARRGPASASS